MFTFPPFDLGRRRWSERSLATGALRWIKASVCVLTGMRRTRRVHAGVSEPSSHAPPDSALEGGADRSDLIRAGAGAGVALTLLLALVAAARWPGPRAPLLGAVDFAWTGLAALITAYLLFSQDSIDRRRGLLVVALGFVILALLTGVHVLGATGAGPAVPIEGPRLDGLALLRSFTLAPASLGYVAFGGARTHAKARSVRPHGALAIIALGLVLSWGLIPLGLGLWQGEVGDLAHALDAEAVRRQWSGIGALLDLLALGALLARRERSRFDLWLFLTVLCAFCELTLLGFFDDGPFDLGWYGAGAFGAAAAATVMVGLLTETAHQLRSLKATQEALLASNQSLEHEALHDSLTGLANRRYFDAYLERQLALTRRNRRDIALVLCDLDDFKLYNDRHGHQAGDETLARIAAVLQTCARRPGDMAARYGGEEFALVLPETDLASARRIAEAARDAVARLRIPHSGAPRSGAVEGGAPFLTLSGGVAVLGAEETGSVESLLAAADAALFRAKSEGRDRVVAEGDAPAQSRGPGGADQAAWTLRRSS